MAFALVRFNPLGAAHNYAQADCMLSIVFYLRINLITINDNNYIILYYPRSFYKKYIIDTIAL